MSVSPSEDIHIRTAHLGAESTLKLLQLEQRQRAPIAPELTVNMMFAPERLSISDAWTYTVGDTPVNAPPTIDPVSAITAAQGTTITKQLSATDPEGTRIAWDITGRDGATGASMNANGVFTWNVPNGQAVRRYDITIRARDRNGGNGNKSDTITLTVHITRRNNAPTLGAIGNKSVKTGQQITISLLGQDADGDDLTYDISADNSSGGTLDSSTGVFVWTPSSVQTRTITFRVRDPSGASATRSTTITVTAPVVNASPPVIDAISNKALRSGQAGSFTARARDPDSLAITFADSHAKISKVGTPTLQQDGKYAQRFAIAATTNNGTATTSYSVTITATATGGTPANETDTTTFSVITEPNGPPVLAAIGDKSVRAGQQLRIQLSATDPEGNAITFSRSGNRGSINATTGVFTWTPNNSHVGNTDITFTARTQVGHSTRRTDTETIRITVSAVTASPPTWTRTPSDATESASRAGTNVTYRIEATDPNNLPIVYSVLRGSASIQIISGRVLLTATRPAAGSSETYAIRATATGGNPANEYIDHTWTITVEEPDYSPNISITYPVDGTTRPRIPSGTTQLLITATRYDGTAIDQADLTVTQTGQPTTIGGRTNPYYESRTNPQRWIYYIPNTGSITLTVSYTDTINNKSYSSSDSVTITVT